MQYNLPIFGHWRKHYLHVTHGHFGLLHSQILSRHFYSTEVSDCFRKLISGSPLINKQLTAVPDLVQWPLPYYEDDRIKPQSYVQYLTAIILPRILPPTSTTAFFQVLFYHEDFKTL